MYRVRATDKNLAALVDKLVRLEVRPGGAYGGQVIIGIVRRVSGCDVYFSTGRVARDSLCIMMEPVYVTTYDEMIDDELPLQTWLAQN